MLRPYSQGGGRKTLREISKAKIDGDMNKLRTSKMISMNLMIFAAVFLLAQFGFQRIESGGAWCTPYLDAPTELGHFVYRFVSYGFPMPFVTIAKENCFSQQSTTYEWFLPGVTLDSLLLGLLLLLGFRRLRKMEES